MIDTDKYEGHPPAPWGWRHKVSEYRLTANGDKDWIDIQVDEDTDPTVMALIADAPLLLQALIDERAEVKRLSEITDYVKSTIDFHYHSIDNNTGGFVNWMEFARQLYLMFYGDEEE